MPPNSNCRRFVRSAVIASTGVAGLVLMTGVSGAGATTDPSGPTTTTSDDPLCVAWERYAAAAYDTELDESATPEQYEALFREMSAGLADMAEADPTLDLELIMEAMAAVGEAAPAYDWDMDAVVIDPAVVSVPGDLPGKWFDLYERISERCPDGPYTLPAPDPGSPTVSSGPPTGSTTGPTTGSVTELCGLAQDIAVAEEEIDALAESGRGDEIEAPSQEIVAAMLALAEVAPPEWGDVHDLAQNTVVQAAVLAAHDWDLAAAKADPRWEASEEVADANDHNEIFGHIEDYVDANCEPAGGDE